MTAPDDLLSSFFKDATKTLLELDCPKECEGNVLALSDFRMLLMDKQRSCLSRVVYQHNEQNDSRFTVEQVQERLAKLRNDISVRPQLQTARTSLDDAARMALSKLVLYSETHDASTSRNLQTSGRFERSQLLEFVALCQTAVKLDAVKQHLCDGSPLFDDLPKIDMESLPTLERFPQKRLEKIQRLMSQAVGVHPDFTTTELKRIFTSPHSSEYANDPETLKLFEQLVSQMNVAITNASLQSSEQALSDMDQGGVTRVVSVNITDVATGEGPSYHTAPTKQTMLVNDPQSSDVQKQQLRMASQAAVLQQELLGQLLNMKEHDRDHLLEQATKVTQDFLQHASSLTPGPERISFLQSVDPETSRLLAMHKLWSTQQNGDKAPR
jgi:hypothetical protein